MSQGHLVGIDLGTTMSVIAYLNATGEAMTIPNREGQPLTQSAIYLDLAAGKAIVGRSAKAAAVTHPDKVATLVKRYMGYAQYGRPVDGRMFRPETLSAIILRKLKQDAEQRIGPISQAVITVPAFFDDTRRKATMDAGRIAGLDVLEIINEPTAAAVAYSLEGRLRRDAARPPDLPEGRLTAVVYDLGGGTFDVTVVRLTERKFETLATDGQVQLGGKDWDDRIVDFVNAKFEALYKLNPKADPKHCVQLGNLAETTKHLLTDLSSATIECTYRGQHLETLLTRDEFEKMTRDLLLQTETVTDLVVKEQAHLAPKEQAHLAWHKVDRVLLVGGSTRMPAVKAMLRRLTGKEPDDRLDPDQVVARGAAIFAAIAASRGPLGHLEEQLDGDLIRKLRESEVVNVNSHSLGVEAFNPQKRKYVNSVLIPKNTPLPFAFSKVYRLREAGVRQFTVKVLEGEAEDAAANIQIGDCRVTDLPPNLPVKAPVQVRLSYKKNGRVEVMALDMTSGQLAHAEIRSTTGLSEEEIRREAKFVQSLEIR
jgi:molecular chaperone DnaK